MEFTQDNISREVSSAVSKIRQAILQSQERAVKAVNQEQLALYYGIGRFISANTRNKNWGKGVIEGISSQLKQELPGLRGFGATNLKNMRLFYEAWNSLERNSSVATDETNPNSAIAIAEFNESLENEYNTIRQLQLTNLEGFPLAEFLSISFTHHIAIINNAKDFDERLFYIRYCHNYKPTSEALPSIIKKQDLFHNQGALPNNFVQTIPEYKQAFNAIRMFKDEYLLDFINVEELGMRDEEVDERVIEQNIVNRVKNFIMAFGKGFAFIGNQVHFDKFGHDHWIDLLFYNRDLQRTVVFDSKRATSRWRILPNSAATCASLTTMTAAKERTLLSVSSSAKTWTRNMSTTSCRTICNPWV